MNTNKKIMIGSLVLIVIAFYGGMKYGQSGKTSALAGNFRAGNTAFAGGRGARGIAGGMGGAVFGEILSKDTNGITVKAPDGSSKIVIISNATSISKEASGTPSDLIVGKSIVVNGTSNSDGSITANSIQLNARAMFFSTSTRPQN